MKAGKTTSKLFNISCDSRKHVLSDLLLHISKTHYKICTASQSITDVLDVTQIQIELEIEGRYIDGFINDIQNMEGVYQLTVSFGSTLQIATYQIAFNADSAAVLDIIKSHNTQIINIEKDNLIVLHIAAEKDIRLLYNKLDNTELLGFTQLPITMAQRTDVTQ